MADRLEAFLNAKLAAADVEKHSTDTSVHAATPDQPPSHQLELTTPSAGEESWEEEQADGAVLLDAE